MATSPGWYADPAGSPFERFWDGNAWTGQTRPGPVQAPTFTAPSPYPAPFHSAGQRTSPWYKRKRYIVPAAVVGTLGVFGAIGAANQSPTKTTSAAASISTTDTTRPNAPAPTTPTRSAATTTKTATLAKPAATPSKTTPPVQDSRTTKPAATSAPNADAGSFRMPNEVGSVLQTAQDDVQRVSGDPVFFTHSHDLLGVRFQVLDRDWKVCSQNVRAGTKVSAAGHIDFGVVKLDETCP